MFIKFRFFYGCFIIFLSWDLMAGNCPKNGCDGQLQPAAGGDNYCNQCCDFYCNDQKTDDMIKSGYKIWDNYTRDLNDRSEEIHQFFQKNYQNRASPKFRDELISIGIMNQMCDFVLTVGNRKYFEKDWFENLVWSALGFYITIINDQADFKIDTVKNKNRTAELMLAIGYFSMVSVSQKDDKDRLIPDRYPFQSDRIGPTNRGILESTHKKFKNKKTVQDVTEIVRGMNDESFNGGFFTYVVNRLELNIFISRPVNGRVRLAAIEFGLVIVQLSTHEVNAFLSDVEVYLRSQAFPLWQWQDIVDSFES